MIEEACKQAAKWARAQLIHKSSNKLAAHNTAASRVAHSSVQQMDQFKRIDAWFEVTELFSQQRQLLESRDLTMLGDVRATKAGNCSAYSHLALAYLLANFKELVATRVSLGEPGDHVFVVASNQALNIQTWPKDMTQWPDYVWVCDPWANVVSPAKGYYQSFDSKMSKWSNDGKRILDAQGTWITPNKPQYLDALRVSEKKEQPWVGKAPTPEDLKADPTQINPMWF